MNHFRDRPKFANNTVGSLTLYSLHPLYYENLTIIRQLHVKENVKH